MPIHTDDREKSLLRRTWAKWIGGDCPVAILAIVETIVWSATARAEELKEDEAYADAAAWLEAEKRAAFTKRRYGPDNKN